jgi:ABC-type lipoprotein release transport system permease subunit
MRLMSSLLFGVAPTDAATFAIGSALLLTLSLVASYVPARRATTIDPIVALRAE